jgi:hypothetical protein
MRHFLRQFGFLLLTFVGLSTLMSFGCLWQLRQSSFYKPSFLVNSVKENNFDYIVLGASTGLTTLNTKVIDSVLDTKGLNLAMDDTSMPSHYLMLQHFIAEGKKTKYVIIAPSNLNFDSEKAQFSDNDYRFLMYVNRPYVYDYYKQFDIKESHLLKGSKWLPMLGVSYYNAELFYPSLVTMTNPERRNRFDNEGNYSYPMTSFNESYVKERNVSSLILNNLFLEKIKVLCEQHQIQLICYVSPMATKTIQVNSSAYHIVNHSDLLLDSSYFYDDIHVNVFGQKTSSISFANEFTRIQNQEPK